MIKLSTEWTVDWVARLLVPIEDWLNDKCPLVPRSRLDEERRNRLQAEYALWEAEQNFNSDYEMMADDFIIAGWPPIVAKIEDWKEQESRRNLILVTVKPHHNSFQLEGPPGDPRPSPRLLDYIVHRASRHFQLGAENAVREALKKRFDQPLVDEAA